MFEKFIARYENALLNDVIPFWEKNCIDKEFGGYFTSLDRDGSVYDYNKYMWMQWRIVYMFGEFYASEYKQERYLQIAKDGFDFLYSKGRAEDGSYYFALNRAGEPIISQYNVFSDCFAAMGAAEMYRATGEQKYYDAAREAMDSYLKRVASGNPAGCWNKSMPARQSYQALGHYMMIANLALVMKRGLGITDYDKAGADALDLVLDKFWNEEYQVVFENILPDGSFDLESCQGRMLNPGHVLEAMWFMLDYMQETGNTARQAEVLKIIEATLNFGWDKEFGGIFYFMDVLGKPHLELQHDMKLWWVHNEAIIACLYAYKVTNDEKFLNWFYKLDDWTWNHFPDPEYGEWFAYLNRRGEPTHLLKGGKWKTFFHLPRCLFMWVKLMKDMDKQN